MTAKTEALFKWCCKRLFFAGLITWAVLWGLLECMRHWAEHQSIPVSIIEVGPPRGPLAAQMKAAGITSVGVPVPYEQVTNPPITSGDIAAIRLCLARERFLPLFPAEIEWRDGEVTAHSHSKRGRYIAVLFGQKKERWRIVAITEGKATVCYTRPPTLWEKVLSYLPFVN